MNANSLTLILKNPSLKALFRAGCLALIFAASSHCSQKAIVFQDPCAGVDLYELGRQDGTSGKPSPEHAAVDELNECVPNKPGKGMKMYNAGRNAGLVEYCTHENGLTVGRSDQSYFYVCPEFMEPEFLTGYHKGIKIRRIEEEKRELNADIAELSALIDREPADSVVVSPLREQVKNLKKQQLSLDKKLSDTKSL